MHHLWLYLSAGFGILVVILILSFSRVARVVFDETVSAPKERSEIAFSSESHDRKRIWIAASPEGDSVRRRIL